MVEAYLKEKDSLEITIADLQAQIVQLRKDNDDNAYQLEKQHLVEKNKLKNQMIEKLNEIASEFRNALFEKIDITTKKVMRENFLLNSHNKLITDQINKLIRENEYLKETVNKKQKFIF